MIRTSPKTIEILEVYEWETPASHYEEETLGTFQITRRTQDRGYRHLHGIDGYTLYNTRKPIEITVLREFKGNWWSTWMADNPSDFTAMQRYAAMAYGDVLTTGLGLGLVTHELCKNSEVTGVTIVELNQGVIDLVGKYLPQDKRVAIEHGNFMDFIEQDKRSWDTIIVDLWVFVGEDKQIELYRNEVLPLDKKLRTLHPESKLIYHAFNGMPPIEEVDRAVQEGKDTVKMLFGLGGHK